MKGSDCQIGASLFSNEFVDIELKKHRVSIPGKAGQARNGH